MNHKQKTATKKEIPNLPKRAVCLLNSPAISSEMKMKIGKESGSDNGEGSSKEEDNDSNKNDMVTGTYNIIIVNKY